jgi:hypothetical protein
MQSIQFETPLNQTQIEILKLFTRDLSESELLEIKRLIVKFLADQLTQKVDAIWAEKGWTNEDMQDLLNSVERTAYNPHH